MVENLTEEILRDRDHLTELLFICQGKETVSAMLICICNEGFGLKGFKCIC